jgi:hypothetical protein
MTDNYRREITTRRVEWVVPSSEPWGACWTEVMKAISACRQELIDADVIEADAAVPDDMIRILPGDDAVVVRIELKQ